MYPFLLVTHLLAAIAFIGTLFFEVAIWHRARQQLADTAQSTADQAIAVRSRKVLHGVVLLLYGAGIGLAWQYRGALSQPLASSFGTLLSLKIILALSIIGHYLLLAYWLTQARLTATRATWIRRSILGHMVLIVILAKAMFYWHG
ncbi:CopD family copper resistance protein [Pseudomonas sp. MDT1-85]